MDQFKLKQIHYKKDEEKLPNFSKKSIHVLYRLQPFIENIQSRLLNVMNV